MAQLRRDPWSTTPHADSPGRDGNTKAAAKSAKSHAKKRFILTPTSVLSVDDDTDAKIFVCSYLRVDASTRDANSSEWGRLLTWKDSEGK